MTWLIVCPCDLKSVNAYTAGVNASCRRCTDTDGFPILIFFAIGNNGACPC